MLRFVTQKLKSQSLEDCLNEVDTDRDSGTESDDENLELEQLQPESEGVAEHTQHDTSSYGSISPHSLLPHTLTSLSSAMDDNTLDEMSSTSDFERCSLDFDRNSSEDELSVIEQFRECDEQKRMWSDERLNCDSATSTDDEIQQLLLPQPVTFCESPPSNIANCAQLTDMTEHSNTEFVEPSPTCSSQLQFNTSHTPVNTISPRKRTRETALDDSTDEDCTDSVRRPSLDFEKMQKTIVKKHCSHSIARTRIVRVKTVNAAITRSRCLYQPEICTFRSISMSPFAATVDTAPFAF